MSTLSTLHDLLVHQLKDLHSAERQLIQALPKMAKAATTPALAEAIQMHLEETKEQLVRLTECLELLDAPTRGPKCKAMEGLLAEGAELLETESDPTVLDAGIIAAAQRVEHYEIAGYSSVIAYARVMGHEAVLALLEQTLGEEQQADQTLTSIADEVITELVDRDGQRDMDETPAAAARPPAEPRTTVPPRGGSTTGGRRQAKAT